MATRAAATILFINRQILARADFGPGQKPVLTELWQQPRPDLDDFPSLVELALGLGPKPGRKVWVLSTDLWTQSLSVPFRTVAKLTEKELAQALSYELETLS